MRALLIGVSVCGLVLAGCGSDDADSSKGGAASATALLTSTDGNTATASIEFTTAGSQVKAVAMVSGATPGVHGFHIHANGACGADGMEAGGHWDPTTMMHGQWSAGAHHLGDIGNVTVSDAGTGSVELTTDAWSIGTGQANDVVGHAAVLHAAPDDFTTQPTGNAGGRIACGVITLD